MPSIKSSWSRINSTMEQEKLISIKALSFENRNACGYSLTQKYLLGSVHTQRVIYILCIYMAFLMVERGVEHPNSNPKEVN